MNLFVWITISVSSKQLILTQLVFLYSPSLGVTSSTM